MIDGIVNRGLIFGIIMMLFTSAFLQVVAEDMKSEDDFLNPIILESIVHVNNDYDESTLEYGVKNFSTVQDGIDNVSEGGYVYVHNGTYYENVIIDKSLSLMGVDEDYVWGGDSNGSIINAIDENESIVRVTANEVVIVGFVIANSYNGTGIFIESDENSLIENIVINNHNGIKLSYSLDNKILNCNIISNNGSGIGLFKSENNNISFSNISYNKDGILMESNSNKNKIYHNNIFENKNGWSGGIRIENCEEISITKNNIYSCEYGIILEDRSSHCEIYENIVNDNLFGIYFISSDYNEISNNNLIFNNSVGIMIDTSDINNIEYNSIFQNKYGIVIRGFGFVVAAQGNSIYGNEIIENIYGIDLYSTRFTGISNNSIIDNEISIQTKFSFFDYIIFNNIESRHDKMKVDWSFILAPRNWWGTTHFLTVFFSIKRWPRFGWVVIFPIAPEVW